MKNNFKKMELIANGFGAENFFSISADRTIVSLMARFNSKLNKALNNDPKWSAELGVESNWIQYKRSNITITICLDL
jgi:hypothetical protein